MDEWPLHVTVARGEFMSDHVMDWVVKSEQ